MNKLIPFFLFTVLFTACKEKEDDNIIWEKSPGAGNAFFIESTADSGVLGCGILAGKPYLVKFSKNKSIEAEYFSERPGLFSSALQDHSGFIIAGSSSGKMLLAKIGVNGSKMWDTTLVAGFYVDITRLIYEGEDTFLAVGSASPDSANNGDTEILFVRFTGEGEISYNQETVSASSSFISANNIASDAAGNIYLAITKKTGSQKPKAIVVKYNHDLQKLWETELYNNPDFAAACYGIAADGSGNIVVTGRTEASNLTGTLNNSFLASLSRTGGINWKRYMENSNAGSSIFVNDAEEIFMLNRNCFVIRKTTTADGSDTGIIRLFSQCDSYTTDAFGYDISPDPYGNILTAGSRGGNFYLALKSSQ